MKTTIPTPRVNGQDVEIPVHPGRVAEMIARGYAIVALPGDPQMPVTMAGPDPDSSGSWRPLSALVREVAHV